MDTWGYFFQPDLFDITLICALIFALLILIITFIYKPGSTSLMGSSKVPILDAANETSQPVIQHNPSSETRRRDVRRKKRSGTSSEADDDKRGVSPAASTLSQTCPSSNANAAAVERTAGATTQRRVIGQKSRKGRAKPGVISSTVFENPVVQSSASNTSPDVQQLIIRAIPVVGQTQQTAESQPHASDEVLDGDWRAAPRKNKKRMRSRVTLNQPEQSNQQTSATSPQVLSTEKPAECPSLEDNPSTELSNILPDEVNLCTEPEASTPQPNLPESDCADVGTFIRKPSKSRRKRRPPSSRTRSTQPEISSPPLQDASTELVPQDATDSKHICDSEFEVIELPSSYSLSPEQSGSLIESDLDLTDVGIEKPTPPPRPDDINQFPCLPGSESQFVCHPPLQSDFRESGRHPRAESLITAALNEREVVDVSTLGGPLFVANTSGKSKRSKARKAD